MIKNFSAGVIVGLFLGTIGLVFACVLCLMFAFSTGNHGTLPGVFDAWPGYSHGMLQIRFMPNFTGIAIAIGVWAVLCGFFAMGLHRRSERANRRSVVES